MPLPLLPRPTGSFAIAQAEGEWLTERTAGRVCAWRQYLRRREEEDLGATLQRHERTGRPLEDKSFVQQISRLLARDPLPGKPGRPRRDENEYGVPILLWAKIDGIMRRHWQ
jgi:hypothetical protein